MKKKIVALFLSVIVGFSFAACGNSKAKSEVPNSESIATESNSQSSDSEENNTKEKNDFNPDTNTAVNFFGYSLSLPASWSEGDNSSFDCKYYYAETDGAVAMIQLSCSESFSSDFDGLYFSKDSFIEAFGSAFESFELVQDDICNVGGTQGLSFEFTGSQEDLHLRGKVVSFVCETDNNLISVSLIQSNNTEYDYFADFEKILNSVTFNSSDAPSAETNEAASGSVSAPSDTPSSAASEPAPTSTPTAEPTPEVSVENQNALRQAHSYLSFSAFSYSGLIEQLEYEGYSTEAATYAVDNCGADWFEQAAKQAQSYLDFSAFSYSGLIEQLEYEGYTTEQATSAVDNCGADWNEQAALAAQSYIEYSSFSRQGLIDQLLYEGFSSSQAEYGVSAVGY